eukprot:NODE_131_length_18300_cov_0.442668.p5 type:complete len:398 gc:universal NODE_131_length_18300_cov_0.442668:6498-7691(+)
MKPSEKLHFATQLIRTQHDDPYQSSSFPLYLSATFHGNGAFDYSRSGNPSRSHVETHLAKLQHAHSSFCVSSGMSALDVILRLLKSGDHIICGNDLYGGSHRLLTFYQRQNISLSFVDTSNINAIKSCLNNSTKMILLETPTNPLLKVCDIELIAQMAHAINSEILVVVDNTMMSPYLQQPLDLGADISYHSGTKYLSGHHDLSSGVIGCANKHISDSIYFVVNATGCGLNPFDCFLLTRGIKTLAVRMDYQQRSALHIAKVLESCKLKVFYPGLKSHPQYELHKKQSSGVGSVLSFITNSVATSERILELTQLWSISVSFGCVNSLISMPCQMSHASIPEHIRKERQLPEDLIRLCVGIEDVRDLLNDLIDALVEAKVIDREQLQILVHDNIVSSK